MRLMSTPPGYTLSIQNIISMVYVVYVLSIFKHDAFLVHNILYSSPTCSSSFTVSLWHSLFLLETSRPTSLSSLLIVNPHFTVTARQHVIKEHHAQNTNADFVFYHVLCLLVGYLLIRDGIWKKYILQISEKTPFIKYTGIQKSQPF